LRSIEWRQTNRFAAIFASLRPKRNVITTPALEEFSFDFRCPQAVRVQKSGPSQGKIQGI
jgi:hypothetical protein